MSSFLEGSLARTVGKAFKNVFLNATLTRDVPGTVVDPAEPPAPTQTEYTCKAIEEEYSISERATGEINSNDVKILILATTLATDPQEGDRISITRAGVVGPTRTIVPAGAGGLAGVTTDPARAVWACRATK